MGAEQSNLIEVTSKEMVTFKINGKQYSISSHDDKIGPRTMLVDYIRDHAGLRGTKFMCREGGCGICVVTVKSRDTHTGKDIVRGVNSCLVPILACDGWEILTIEALGNHKDGLHPIQERFMKLSGTQCGFCTPGWIMNTYSMTLSKGNFSVADVEDCTDGNMCRCTGYRPIIDVMKSLAKDAPEELKRKCADIENLPCCAGTRQCRKRSDDSESSDFEAVDHNLPVRMEFKYGEQWVKAHDMNSLFMGIQKMKAAGVKYKIVAGNTGSGVYKNDGPFQGFIELNSVHSIRKQEVTAASLVLGGAVTIAMAIESLEKYSAMEGFQHFKAVIKHWKRVANVSVRNLGTLAGNLMLKHHHREFPSDIFLVLETLGAMLTIASSPSLQKMYTLQDFLAEDMEGKIIYSIHIPKLTMGHFRSFKITRRFQNAHAYVNAGFLINVDSKFVIKTKPSIVYGGISPDFIHASMTEEYLVGKTINEETIKGAMATLDKEVQPDMQPPDAHPTYRKALTKALLYKVFLDLLGGEASSKFASGATDIVKRLTTARHDYEFPTDEWPLYQPVPKIESPYQCSGEAEYTNDISPATGEVHGAVVVTTVANAMLKDVDVSEALKFPGVVGWVDYRNIPGENNYMKGADKDGPDVIFVQDKIRFAGEPIGAIMAETRDASLRARELIKVNYDKVEKPVIDIPAALEKAAKEGKFFRDHLDEPLRSSVDSLGAAPPHKFKGEFKVHSQLHFPMEPQICICIPRDDCMDVYSATQDTCHVQRGVATALGLPCNQVNVFVRRLGGGFGNKLARSAHLAAICAVASHTLRRPVRILLDMETWFEMFGKRLPHLFHYDVGFDDNGKIWSFDVKFVCDAGANASEATNFLTPDGFQNVYKAEGWTAQKGHVYTDTAPNYFCRFPGIPKSTACMETIMDRIAWYLKKDPMEVRLNNLLKKGDISFPRNTVIEEENIIPEMIKEMSVSADIPEREKFVEKFNSMNRWKKRGLAIFPCRDPIAYVFSDYKVYVAVYGHDGTVAVCHSGVEMGQGISTKIAQVVARELRIPLAKVKVKPHDTFTGANCTFTGTGVTSENMCYAAWKACKALNERLEPIKAKLENPTWEKVAAYCKANGMDLTSYGCTTYADGLKTYDLYSLAVSEVEIDCLTGEYKIIRVDIMTDIGYAISPDVDIGQIEGAYTMGIGYFLQEKVQYDQETGRLLTNRTWNYKPPLAKDIPEDFRLTLRKKAPNPFGVLRSKATGEPAYLLSYCIVMALRRAITAARMDAGNTDWFDMDTPITPEDVQRLCLTNEKDFAV